MSPNLKIENEPWVSWYPKITFPNLAVKNSRAYIDQNPQHNLVAAQQSQKTDEARILFTNFMMVTKFYLPRNFGMTPKSAFKKY